MVKKSPVWRYFDEPVDASVKCKLCGKTLAWNKNTSALAKHLATHHQITVHQTGGSDAKRQRVQPDDDVLELDADDPLPAQQEPSSNSNTGRSRTPPIRSGCETSSSQSAAVQRCNNNTDGPLKRYFNYASSFLENGSRAKTAHMALAYMVAADNMPLCTPEKTGFKFFVSKVNPAYKLPCEETLRKILDEKYVEYSAKMAQIFRENTVSLTCDIWTETMTIKSYLGVTVHYIDKESELVSISLGAKCIFGMKKTGDNLAKVLQEICEKWGIVKEKVAGVVTDNGANIALAVKKCFGADKHYRCLAHIANLVAMSTIKLYSLPKNSGDEEITEPEPEEPSESDGEQDNDDDVQLPTDAELAEPVLTAIRKVKKIVRFSRQCEACSSHILQQQLNETDANGKKIRQLKDCLKLIQEVPTRWNSLYEMLARYMKLYQFVEIALNKVHEDKTSKAKVPSSLSRDEIDLLRDLKRLLKPLLTLTNTLCKEKQVTLSMVIPVIKILRMDLEKAKISEVLIFPIRDRLLDQIDSRLKPIETSLAYGIASLCDPRFKGEYLRDNPIFYSRAKNVLGEMVRANMDRVREERERDRDLTPAAAADQSADPTPTPTLAAAASAGPPTLSIEDDSDEEVTPSKAHNNIVSAQRRAFSSAPGIRSNPAELIHYLQQPICSWETDPLKEWQYLKRDFPNVYDVARDYLVIPATSVPAERLFSRAGRLVTKPRNRLSGERVEKLLFLGALPTRFWFPE